MSFSPEEFPGFTSGPNRDRRDPHWEVLRCGAKEQLTGIVLSHNLVGCYLHFYGRRSVPCKHPAPCVACDDSSSRRWYGYLAVMDCRKHDRAIVEVTDGCEPMVHAAFCKFRTLRGLKFVQKRRGEKANGGLMMVFNDSRIPQEQIPHEPDLRRMLLRMWEVPDVGASGGGVFVAKPNFPRLDGGVA